MHCASQLSLRGSHPARDNSRTPACVGGSPRRAGRIEVRRRPPTVPQRRGSRLTRARKWAVSHEEPRLTLSCLTPHDTSCTSPATTLRHSSRGPVRRACPKSRRDRSETERRSGRICSSAARGPAHTGTVGSRRSAHDRSPDRRIDDPGAWPPSRRQALARIERDASVAMSMRRHRMVLVGGCGSGIVEPISIDEFARGYADELVELERLVTRAEELAAFARAG